MTARASTDQSARPTICGTSSRLLATAGADGPTFEVDADEVRQVELVSASQLHTLARELGRVERVVVERRMSPRAPSAAYARLAPRVAIDPGTLSLPSLMDAFAPVTHSRRLRYKGVPGFIDGGYSFHCADASVVSGTASDDDLLSAGFLHTQTISDATLAAIDALLAKHALVLVDWCGLRISRGGEATRACFFGGPKPRSDVENERVDLVGHTLALDTPLRLSWSRARKAKPFQVAPDEKPSVMRWTPDATRLWTRAARREPPPPWIEWDARTGARIRTSDSPQGTRADAPKTLVDLPDIAGATRASPDGALFIGPARKKLGLVIARASDGATVRHVPNRESTTTIYPLAWTSEDRVVVQGRGEALSVRGKVLRNAFSGLFCLRLTPGDDDGTAIWKILRHFPQLELSSDGSTIAAIDDDDNLWILDTRTGKPLRHVKAKDRACGPLLCGERDTYSTHLQLVESPVMFDEVVDHAREGLPLQPNRDAIGALGVYLDPRTGEVVDRDDVMKEPWRVRAMHAAAKRLLAPEKGSYRAITRDGRRGFYNVSRNVTEMQDPDAGSVSLSDDFLVCCEEREGCTVKAWEIPFQDGTIWKPKLSWDESGLFTVTTSGAGRDERSPLADTVHDVVDGVERPVYAGDFIPWPPSADRSGARALDASLDGHLVLILRGTVLEAWDARRDVLLAKIDGHIIDDTIVAATVITRENIVLATGRGRVLAYELPPAPA